VSSLENIDELGIIQVDLLFYIGEFFCMAKFRSSISLYKYHISWLPRFTLPLKYIILFYSQLFSNILFVLSPFLSIPLSSYLFSKPLPKFDSFVILIFSEVLLPSIYLNHLLGLSFNLKSISLSSFFCVSHFL